MTETDSSSSRTTESRLDNSVAPLPFLDQSGIDHALRFIMENWPNNAPMKAAVKEAWQDVLCQLRLGELKSALARRTDNKSHRPEPYAILEIVLEMRQDAARAAQSEREQRDAQRLQTVIREAPGKFDPNSIPAYAAGKAKLRGVINNDGAIQVTQPSDASTEGAA